MEYLLLLLFVALWTGLTEINGEHYYIHTDVDDLVTNEGVYRWISNGQIANFTNWHHAEPNNDDAGAPENCIGLFYIDDAMKWNDQPCVTWRARFVCEVPGRFP
ncbi:hypothetical protein B566_EDAN007817 [Ephemera danica]|nr:hypothetical protein B566_EDAN007817 [Ephemera danica]